jgi:predicted enzyme related to lactoylglutathione lyase
MSSHRSRAFCGALVDTPRDSFEATKAFWAGALDRTAKVEDDDPDYASYGEVAPGVEFMVQAVGARSARVHLDIETDDVDAEIARLESLGATVVERIHSWVVMRDPVGIIFCVVRVQIPDAFAAHATTWTG